MISLIETTRNQTHDVSHPIFRCLYSKTEPCLSHFRNKEAHSSLWRYGIPVYLLGTLGLLLASHLGSGVAAEYILYYPDGTEFEQETLFVVSIFTSVNKLWATGSYALVILIVIASILWPYVKLLLTLAAWMFPYDSPRRRERPYRSPRRRERLFGIIDVLGKLLTLAAWMFPRRRERPYRSPRRRERLLEIIDALGKWSFIDIFVLLIIMVAFRATIEVGQGGELC